MARCSLRASASYPFDYASYAFQSDDMSHYVGGDLLPLSPYFPVDDRARITTIFDVRAEGVFPAAAGESVARPEAGRAFGEWRYELSEPVSLLAFTLTRGRPARPTESFIETFGPARSVDALGLVEVFESSLAAHGARYQLPYPDERHTLTQITNVAGVAMGPPAFTLIPEDIWRFDFSDPYMSYNTDMLLSHEAAHQWFYRRLRLGQDSHAWLSEAFAEYSAARFVEERGGSGAPLAEALFHVDREQYLEFVRQGSAEWPLASMDNDLDDWAYLNVTYLRGMAVLRMLEGRLENFDEVLAQYMRAHEGRFVVTEDFVEAVLSLGAPRGERPRADLVEFFDRWVYGTYHLDLLMTARYISDEETGVEVELLSEPLDDAFPLALRGADGAEEVVYLDLRAPLVEFSGGWQGMTLDPTLEFLSLANFAEIADLDHNGLVDGLDALDALARLNDNVGDPMSPRRWLSALDWEWDGWISEREVDYVLLERFGQVTR